jgi:hypothetical protein
VEAIHQFPLPATVKQLLGFLGIVNFYCRFVPGAASILLLLTEYLKGGRAGSAAVEWSENIGLDKDDMVKLNWEP